MAACASGARIASTTMCSDIDPCSGCSACTVTTVSGTASFLQPAKNRSGSERPQSIVMRAAAITTDVCRTRIVVVPGFVMGSEGSRQSLKISERSLITDTAIFARILYAHKCRLSIDHFQHSGLSAGITQLGKAQAFFRSGHADIERRKLIARRHSFCICLIQAREDASLCCRQCDPLSIAANLALLHPM